MLGSGRSGKKIFPDLILLSSVALFELSEEFVDLVLVSPLAASGGGGLWFGLVGDGFAGRGANGGKW